MKTFKILVTSLRGDPIFVEIKAIDREAAKIAFWAWCDKQGIDEAEWQTNSYEFDFV